MTTENHALGGRLHRRVMRFFNEAKEIEMAMTTRQKTFLNKLADLCEEYEAEFGYITDDEGIHINVDGEEIFVGFLYDAPKELRNAADA